MMKTSANRSTEKCMRHSAPMSFFGADFCAQTNNIAILGNTVLSVLLFVFLLVVSPVICLLAVIITAVILLALKGNNSETASYYSYKAS